MDETAYRTVHDEAAEPIRATPIRELPEMGLYRELRYRVAGRELLSREFEDLALAIRFAGHVCLDFEAGRIVRSELRESWVRPPESSPGEA